MLYFDLVLYIEHTAKKYIVWNINVYKIHTHETIHDFFNELFIEFRL